MAYRYQYQDGSILEFSKEPTLKEIELAGINAGAVKPNLRQKYDNVMQGLFQSVTKSFTGLTRTGVGIQAAIDPFNTLEDYARQRQGTVGQGFVPGSQAAKTFNDKYITPQNSYQAGGQLAGDIAQFFAAAPLTGASKVERLAVAPLIDTAIQVNQDIGAGTSGKDLFRNAMLTAGTSILAGVFQPVKNINWMKMGASGALTGYVSDVATGLTGMRGEDREGFNSFIPGAGTAAGTAIGFGTGAMTRFSQAGRNKKVVDNRETILDQLEIDHKDFRKTLDAARETGYDPKGILMYTDALNDTTTKGGRIDMSRPLLRLENEMAPMEPHVFNELKKEGTTITVKQFAKGLTDVLQESRLQLDERALLKSKIEKLIKIGKQVAKENGGVIPLWKVQQRKVSLGQQLRKQYGTVKGSTNKEIARAYKEIIEKHTTSMDVKKYNAILQQLYTFEAVLKSLNGKVIEGGRLGRHVQTLLGTYIGGQVAGPVGAAFGGQMSYKATGARNKRVFGQQSTPMIKKGAYDIAKKATQSRNISGKTNQTQSTKANQSKKVISKTISKKPSVDKMKPRTLLTKIKDTVNKERVKTRSMIRQAGTRGSIGGPAIPDEPVRKLTVSSPENITVNEKFQIIDETKSGADALVGLVGKDLSPELRQEVIKAAKAKDDAKLQALAPRILTEINAKAQRQVSTQTPEEIAAKRAAKLRTESEQRKQTAVRSNQIQIGLSPVQGIRRQKWDDMYDEAEKLRVAGDLAGARKIHAQIITEGKETIQKRAKGSPFEKQITFNGVGYGVFEGSPEPNIDFVVNIKAGQEDLLHKFLADLAKNDFVQKSVLTYKVKPQGDYPLGVIDEATGTANEPHFMFFPDEPLTLERVTAFNEILDSVGLQAMSIKEGGKRVDIIHLSAYDKTNDYNGFKQKLWNLQEALNERGFLGVSERGVAETRLIGDKRESQNISYERNQREFLERNPTFLKGDETIDSPILDSLRYQASISKSEFENLLETSNIGEVEKKVYQEVIKKYPADAQISPKGLYSLLKKKVLKIAPGGEMNNYSDYGWSRLLGDSQIKYEIKTQKIDSDLPISLDSVTHTNSGDVAQFGHFRYAVKKSKGREVFFGETQNDPFQQSGKFERVKETIQDNKDKNTPEGLREDIRRLDRNIQESQSTIVYNQTKIDEARAGDASNDRVVREGRNFLQKVDEELTRLGIQARNPNAPGYTWISRIEPTQEGTPGINDVREGYNVTLERMSGQGGIDSSMLFVPAIERGGELTSGMTRRVEIFKMENDTRAAVNLEELVDDKQANLEASRERYITDLTRAVINENAALANWNKYKKAKTAELKKLLSKAPKSEDTRAEQFLNFKKNNAFVKRTLQEEIDLVIKTEKPKKIFLPTTSTVAKIEGYFPKKTNQEKVKPNYTYGGGFGAGVPNIQKGQTINDGTENFTVVSSYDGRFDAVSPAKLNTIKYPETPRKRNAFLLKDYKENLIKKIRQDFTWYASDADRPWGEALNLDTPLTSKQASLVYQVTRGGNSSPFARSWRSGDIWNNIGDGTITIEKILEHYFKKEIRKGLDRWLLEAIYTKFDSQRQEWSSIRWDETNNAIYEYRPQDLKTFSQPSQLDDSIDTTKSFEEEFDASKDVIRETMQEGNSREVVLHRFDDIKNIYPELEKQFGQQLKPWTDTDTGNTWLYWEPDYQDSRWKDIKKTTF